MPEPTGIVDALKILSAIQTILSSTGITEQTGQGLNNIKQALLQSSDIRDNDNVFFPSVVDPQGSGSYTAKEQLMSIDKCLTSMLAHSDSVVNAMKRHKDVVDFVNTQLK